MSNDTCEYMTKNEVAALLRVTTRTLDNWRDAGAGPPHLVLARRHVRYPHAAVADWIRNNTVVPKA